MRGTVAARKATVDSERAGIVRREAQREADEPLIRINNLPVRSDWSAWSQEQDRKRIEHDVRERTSAVEQAIYPREIAAKMAAEAERQIIPEWRLLKLEHGGAFMRIVKQQPEFQQRDIQQRENLLRAVMDHLPRHLQPAVHDLRVLWELLTVAHEAAAFTVGVETGRRLEHHHVDERGRLRHSSKPARSIKPDTVLRLGLARTDERP
jgi:hypothetical protein